MARRSTSSTAAGPGSQSAEPAFPLPSYSAFGEDRVLAHLLRGRSRGFYVDVGCFEPIAYSNTYLLYREGWHGIAIDADAAATALFAQARPRDIVVTCAVGTAAGPVRLHRFSDASMNTIDESVAAATRANPRKRYLGAIEVERRPLADVLDQYVPAGVAIDFMNVDCEGADFDVLRSNAWTRHRPGVLAVEDFKLDLMRPEDSAILAFLRAQGYRLAAKAGPTAIYRLA